jgi:two-component system cell cycle sensor histidine kinase/response regulator CckA
MGDIAKESLQILHLEDNPNDSELVSAMLQGEGISCTLCRVETRHDFEAALAKDDWSLIISDFSLPSFDGLKAITLARKLQPGIPFILFSGTIGEEMAIESLKSGATDYVLKQRPARLVTAVRHALREADEFRRRREVEAELLKAEQHKKQLEMQFLRVQRMESIGALAGGIAHDLNNALLPVLVGIGVLRLKPHDTDTEQMLGLMETSVRRGADMIKQVLMFTRGVESKETVIKLDLILRELEKIIHDIFPKSIHSRVRFPESLWSVSGSATQLHQVLMNLCINARDAMPRGGQLALSAENVELTAAQAEAYPEAKPGPYVCLTVSDDGFGMPPEVREKIFQPFFTTKEPGKGTGLGLSTSLNIIRNHGGFMSVKSAPGKGSSFSVFLPAVINHQVEQATIEKRVVLPSGHGELILVVDDEAAICEITKATLENYGYRTLTAGSGPEALALFVENRSNIKLVLTDTAMPFMDGRATCLALRQLEPKLKIIAASGTTDRDNEDTTFRAKVNAFVQKPYTVD